MPPEKQETIHKSTRKTFPASLEAFVGVINAPSRLSIAVNIRFFCQHVFLLYRLVTEFLNRKKLLARDDEGAANRSMVGDHRSFIGDLLVELDGFGTFLNINSVHLR